MTVQFVNISKVSGSVEVLCQYHLVIWDECTMSHRGAMEALGDFRQTLSVILRRTRSDEIKACIKSSHLWNEVLKFSFNTNVRASLHGDQGAKFSTWLLQLENGKVPFDGNSDISLAHIAVMLNSPTELKNRVLLDLSNNYNSHKWLCERAILTPKNETVARINHELMNKIPIVIKKYHSVDSILDENQAVHYSTEFLSSPEPPRISPHKLFLKVGVPIMLLRNLDPPKLCNGTRLIVKALSPNVTKATIITECTYEEGVLIPRIPIKPTDMPLDFKRTQFLV
uniref:ATP-dependent DNA helicase n=1 Tax=Octopus bimaculoides TaxID=37653 RepID=A0A0L8G3K7_OCTBM